MIKRLEQMFALKEPVSIPVRDSDGRRVIVRHFMGPVWKSCKWFYSGYLRHQVTVRDSVWNACQQSVYHKLRSSIWALNNKIKRMYERDGVLVDFNWKYMEKERKLAIWISNLRVGKSPGKKGGLNAQG